MSKKRRNPKRKRRKQNCTYRVKGLASSSEIDAKLSLGLHREQIEVPQFGERLLLFFLPRRSDEHEIGDLAEDYGKRFPKLGRRAARTWYYKEVCLLLLKECRFPQLSFLRWIETVIRNNFF